MNRGQRLSSRRHPRHESPNATYPPRSVPPSPSHATHASSSTLSSSSDALTRTTPCPRRTTHPTCNDADLVWGAQMEQVPGAPLSLAERLMLLGLHPGGSTAAWFVAQYDAWHETDDAAAFTTAEEEQLRGFLDGHLPPNPTPRAAATHAVVQRRLSSSRGDVAAHGFCTAPSPSPPTSSVASPRAETRGGRAGHALQPLTTKSELDAAHPSARTPRLRHAVVEVAADAGPPVGLTEATRGHGTRTEGRRPVVVMSLGSIHELRQKVISERIAQATRRPTPVVADAASQEGPTHYFDVGSLVRARWKQRLPPLHATPLK